MAENEWTDEQLRDHLADIDASPVDAVMPAHCRMCAEALRLAAPHPHPQGEAMTIEIPCSDPEVLAEAQRREGCEVWSDDFKDLRWGFTASDFRRWLAAGHPYTIRCATPEAAGELLAWARYDRGALVECDDEGWGVGCERNAGHFAHYVKSYPYRILPPAEPEPWRPSKGDRVRWGESAHPFAVVHVDGDWAWIKSDMGAHQLAPLGLLAPWEPPTETVPWWEAPGRRTAAERGDGNIDRGTLIGPIAQAYPSEHGPGGMYIEFHMPEHGGTGNIRRTSLGLVEVLREDTRP